MLERVAGAIDAGPLPVPHREHAVVARSGEQIGLLRTPDRGRREVLVQPGLEENSARIERLLRAPQLAVEPAERGAAVAGHEARRVEAGTSIEVALREQQPHERLQPGDEQRAGVEPVPLVQPCYLAQLHTTLIAPPTESRYPGIMVYFRTVRR
jgi:hypothetical protein